MYIRNRILAILLTALLLSGCTRGAEPENGIADGTVTVSEPEMIEPVDMGAHFSARDRAGDYDAAGAIRIELSGSTAACTSKAVQIGTGAVTITDEGVYLLKGSYMGMIIVDAEKTDKVQLVLDGASITSAASAALYVKQADKVFVTLAEGSGNTLANGGSFTAIDENNIDGAIFARDDLTLNGTGALTVISPAGHGVVAKDELVIAGGSYTVTASGHGFSANDSICLADAALTVTAGKDGFKTEHDEDAALGYIIIESGAVTVVADGDGLSAGAYLQIADGAFNLTTGSGHSTVSRGAGGDWSWGSGGRGGMGGMPGKSGGSSATDTTSAKGIKAAGDLLISGGSFILDAADDALHSNANLTVAGGTFALASGDDGIHADAATVVSGGKIEITACYEGIEGRSITISGGEISLAASDDGLNAAGGADSSGFGGFFGGRGRGGAAPGGEPGTMPGNMPGNAPGGMPGDAFAEGGEGDMFIRITGGRLLVDAGGDGIDSNGSLIVSGGETYVAGPTNGGNGALDYTTGASITGGTFIAVGAAGMAQNFSSAENQAVVMVNAQGGSAGSEIVLTDADGRELFRWTSPKSYSSVVLSCPGLTQGGRYMLKTGSSSTEIRVDSLISGGGFGGMGGGFGKPDMGGGFGGMPGGKPDMGGGRGGRK